jgi:hypothetical protein
LGLCCCLLGLAIYLQSVPAAEEADRARRDLFQLVRLADEWRSLPRVTPGAAAADPATGTTSLVEELHLRSKMTQLSVRDGGVYVQFDRLYGDEFKNLLGGLIRRRIPVRGMEIKALPQGTDRILAVSLVLGGAP